MDEQQTNKKYITKSTCESNASNNDYLDEICYQENNCKERGNYELKLI